ncbi:MAG: alpha/beta fold hydrolase [Gemmatimonadetes bacterium]|nr:alpha/beta fold hydrolase [Gemmatimonadota bacterium]
MQVHGTRLHYIDEGPGDGDPVVMVHGNPTWSFFYRRPIRTLSDRYRTIVPDHIGMGLSESPLDDAYAYTLASRIDDLDHLLEQRGVVSNVTLIVHDWGGSIGLGYAMRHPGRVKRLVILNTAAFHLPAGKAFPPDLTRIRKSFLGPLLVRGLNAFSLSAVRRCVTTPLSAGVRRGYLEPYNNWRNRLAVLRFVQDIPIDPADRSYDLLTEIEESIDQFQDLPVLICWGMYDFIFDADILAEWTRRLPNAEVHCYSDAGHYVLEDAGVDISMKIRTFLDDHPLPVSAGSATEPHDAGA